MTPRRNLKGDAILVFDLRFKGCWGITTIVGTFNLRVGVLFNVIGEVHMESGESR
jgi:hypothetical protein